MQITIHLSNIRTKQFKLHVSTGNTSDS